MAAVYQAIGNQSAGAASVAVAWPTHVTDDLGIIIIETGGEGTTLTPPAGWTAVTGSPVTDLATTAGSKLQVWYKFAASGAEANVNTGDSGDHQVARIVTFRGVDPTTPFDATPVTDAATTASTSVTWPSITTATDGALIVLIATRPNDATSVTSFGAVTNANLTGIGEAGEGGSNAGHGGGFVVAYGTKDTAGATGTSTCTTTVSTTNAEMVIALRPAIAAGSLSVTETGSDTFSASGTVTDPAITGSLAATEAGADTFSASGDVLVQGSLAVTETGDDTFSASGSVSAGAITGSLAATEAGEDAFSATGDVLVQGSLSATESGGDTFAATGDVIVQGSLAATEVGADTFAATGDVIVQGSLAVTEVGTDSFFASGGNVVTGTLAATEAGADTLASSGTVLVKGSLAATETDADTLSATGTVLVRGSLAATETVADTFAASGGQVRTGDLAATETGSDTFASTGDVFVSGTLAVTETDSDAFSAAGVVPVKGALAATETGADIFYAVQVVVVTEGALAATEAGADVLSSPDNYWTYYAETGYTVNDEIGRVLVQGTGSILETVEDTANAAGQIIVQGTVAATETGVDTMIGGTVIGYARAGQAQRRGYLEPSRPTDLDHSRALFVSPTRSTNL